MRRAGAPAVAVAAVRHGRTVFLDATGVISGEDASAERAVFMVASISKLINAVLCMRLRERGRFDLDEDISRYLGVQLRNPSFPDMSVTSRHLLTHCSGLVDDESAVNRVGRYKTMEQDCPMSLEEYFRDRLANGNCRFWSSDKGPGDARYHYSNAGMTLLGLVIEKAAGKELPSLAQELVFGPLGMTRSKYMLAEARALPDAQLAAPHGREGAHYGLAEFPAAGLRSTAADLARFLEAFTAEAHPVLEGASVREMLPPDFTKGLAWWGRDAQHGNRSGGSWEHGGFMDGVRTHIYLYPGRCEGAVVLTNGHVAYDHIRSALVGLLRDAVDEAAGPAVRQEAPAPVVNEGASP